MKKIVPILLILAVVAIAVVFSAVQPASADAIQTSTAVIIPEALQKILAGVIFTGVMLGLQVVFEWTGLDLRGIGAAVAAAVTGFAIAELQGYINAIPQAYDYFVTTGLNVLVVILSGLGYLRFLVQRERALNLLL